MILGYLPEPETLRCNTGGPMSRTRKERLKSTVLGAEGGLRLPRRLVVGLSFPDKSEDPVMLVRSLLQATGFASAEEARQTMYQELPALKMVAMPWDGKPALGPEPGTHGREAILQALILGLCTANLYDPSRPVLWTQASLTRRLELFDLRGFYEA